MASSEIVKLRNGTKIKATKSEKLGGYHGMMIYASDGTVSTLPSAGGTTFVDVEVGGRIKNPMLRIKVSNASAVSKLVPSSFWYDKIITYIDGDVVQTYYPLAGYCLANAFTPRDVYKSICGDWNQNRDYNEGHTLQTDITNHAFYIPLVGSWLDVVQPVPSALKQRIRLEIQWNSSWVYSGTATNVTCGGVDLVCELDHLPENESKKEYDLWANGRSRHYYTEQVPYPISQTLTASTSVDINPSSLRSDISHLFVSVRPSTHTNASGNSYKFLRLGSSESQGTLQLLNQQMEGVQEVTANGTEWLRKTAHRHFVNSDFFQKKAVYPIVFSDDVESATQGSFNGFYRFTGSEYLRFNPASNAVAETGESWTATPDSTATAGSYSVHFEHRGKSYETAPLAFNDAETVISAAIALLRMPDISVSVTNGGSLFSEGGALTFVITGLDRDLDYGETKLSIVNHGMTETGGAAIAIAVSRATLGIPISGSTATGSSLQIDILGFQHAMCEFENGYLVGGKKLV